MAAVRGKSAGNTTYVGMDTQIRPEITSWTSTLNDGRCFVRISSTSDVEEYLLSCKKKTRRSIKNKTFVCSEKQTPIAHFFAMFFFIAV